MQALRKPKRLHNGDKIAIISPSNGRAGEKDMLWRYEQGKKRLEEIFHLQVVSMPHTLKGVEYCYNHPEKRAEDLMNAFQDESIKAILCCMGGNDSIRMLPYIDFQLMHNHPKILSGYSDITVLHMMCLKAGISSFYGPSLFNDFAENVEMSPYTIQSIQKTWFQTDVIGDIPPSSVWTAQHLRWDEANRQMQRTFKPNHPYEILQGTGKVQGRLLGGCLEVLEYCKGTALFPDIAMFQDAILFLETSEVQAPPWLVEDQLRCYGMMGILQAVKGILWGKPHNEKYYQEYILVIQRILKEFHCETTPVLYNVSFGHNEPKTILPYGAMAEINCEHASFTIVENAVVI